MRIRTTITGAVLLIATLTACDDGTTDAKPRTTPSVDYSAAEKAAGIPPKPMGAKRQDLLDALGKAAPDTIRYEDKAIDAARNQCRAMDGDRPDYYAAQRFTYKDVTTTEAQGKAINAALKSTGFCKI